MQMNDAQGEIVGSIYAIKYKGARMHLTIAQNYPYFDEAGNLNVQTWLNDAVISTEAVQTFVEQSFRIGDHVHTCGRFIYSICQHKGRRRHGLTYLICQTIESIANHTAG